jgi:rhodanese-related sulfurtransferase
MNTEKKQNSGQNNRLIKNVVIIIIPLILLVIFFMVLQNQIAPALTLSKEISVDEAYQLFQNGEFILDVRQPDEYEAGHIPGSVLIPLDLLESKLSEIPQDNEVVVVCRSGNRSATGRDILLKAGFTSVTSMAGGMNQWNEKGYEIIVGP